VPRPGLQKNEEYELLIAAGQHMGITRRVNGSQDPRPRFPKESVGQNQGMARGQR
jgi:hypothetical protein